MRLANDRAIQRSSGTLFSWGAACLPIVGAACVLACERAPSEVARPRSSSDAGPLPLSVPVPETPATPSQVANPWSDCFRGFVAGGEAKRDLLRLATLCGPTTGMQAIGPHFSGQVGAGEDAAVRMDLEVECVRWVAAASAGVADLEVEIVDPKGESRALENLGSSWLVVPKDRPLCLTTAGTYTARVRTHGSDGNFELRMMKYWPSGARPMPPGPGKKPD